MFAPRSTMGLSMIFARRTARRRPSSRDSLEEAPAFSLKHQTGEPSGEEGAGVDVDAVRPHLRRIDGSMAMHHAGAKVGIAGEEGLANPDEVIGVLIIE